MRYVVTTDLLLNGSRLRMGPAYLELPGASTRHTSFDRSQGDRYPMVSIYMKPVQKIRLLSLLVGLGSLSLGGCNSQPPTPTEPAASPTPAATAQVSPSTTPSPEVAIAPATSRGRPITCETRSYLADITWQQGQGKMTFLRKPSETLLNNGQGVTSTVNPDGSTTYAHQGDGIFYTRVYPNNTCLVQAIARNGSVTLEESGRIRSSAGGLSVPPASPTPATSPPRPLPAPVEPNQDNLSMQCPGSIQDAVDFTAYFTREAGFSRVELRPRTSNQPLTAYLSYSGKNAEGQSIWRGSVAQMADVTLVHMSAAPAKSGDLVSVGYDGRWGRASCR